jgi:hypothetical protein
VVIGKRFRLLIAEAETEVILDFLAHAVIGKELV